MKRRNHDNGYDETLLRLWGKTDREDSQNYHPLLFHLLDVGYVTQRLWSLLPQRLRERIAAALGLDEGAAGRLLVLLGAQHDLGKASAFQYKDAGLWNQLNAVGLTISYPIDKPHGYVTSVALPGLIEKGIAGWRAEYSVALLLAQITGGHHGTFPTASDLQGISSPTLGDEDWNEVRCALLQEVARILLDGQPTVNCPQAELTDPAIIPLVGGLISVADWIGSSSHFPPMGPIPIDEYAQRSRKQAANSLEDFGWTASPAFAPAAFGELFQEISGKPFVPNAMQTQAVTWADAAMEPYLMIIEAAMGDGKTEAALYAIDRALTTHLARGFYVALPTQATGNAMFKRVREYLKKHDGVLNLQLVHAGALLSDDYEALRKAANALKHAEIYDDTGDPGGPLGDEGVLGRVVAEGWFAARKRPLLAPFGVGTIDQSLLGVLQTRHWFVRLLGLAGKVVIFDEVHAYDVYMSTLLCRLLSWLRALDCTVILLSATLPTSARDALLGAWRGNDHVPEPACYPRLTFSCGDAPPKAVTVADTQASSKNVSLAWVTPDWESVLGRLRADLPDGGCALLLCNTVTRAQQAFRTLRPVLQEGGWTVKQFHARMPAKWRQKREKWVLKAFGKNSPAYRRDQKILLIATQVVEQSLDLDFDWMASEMAPADLLLQRMGRLWRHAWLHAECERATNTARFVILCGQNAEGFPVFPDYTELIYEPYVLLRSWLALKHCGDTLTLPQDIDSLVQEVYGPDIPHGLSDKWIAALQESRDKLSRNQQKDGRLAEANSIPGPELGPEEILEYGSRLDQVRKDLYDGEDPRVHEAVCAMTRLGEPSIGVVCAGTAEDGKSLADPGSVPPDLDAARKLLRFSMPFSHRGLYHALVAQESPAAWKDTALLRYHRLLNFVQGRQSLAGYELRLSRDEGLVIEKHAKGAEE